MISPSLAPDRETPPPRVVNDWMPADKVTGELTLPLKSPRNSFVPSVVRKSNAEALLDAMANAIDRPKLALEVDWNLPLITY